MRSKLGTKSRLAAHISAFVLLILMLVYVAPPQVKPDQASVLSPAAQPAPPAEPAVTERQAEPPTGEPRMTALQPEMTDIPAASVAVIASTPANPVATLDQAGEAALAETSAGELRPPSAEAAPELASAPESAPLSVSAPETAVETPPETPVEAEPAVVASAAPAMGEAEPPADPVEHVEPEEPAIEPETPVVEPVEETPPADVAEPTPSEPAEPTETAPVSEPESESASESASEPEPESGPETVDGDESFADSGEPITALVPATPAEPSEQPEPAAPTGEPASEEQAGESDEGDAVPAAEQPDESGALVVAAPEEDSPAVASSPLPNATNLEVLDDGIYWLDSRHDLEKELASVPDLGTLILLAPLPGYRGPDVGADVTEVIPAAAADLTEDAAARFLHLTASSPRPVVVAALPGAHGAAFFKGAYLLVNRNLDADEMLAEIENELDEAGAAREEIEHRLMRLNPAALR